MGRASCWAYLPLFLCALLPSLTQRSSVQITDYVLSANLQGAGNTVNNLAEKERVLSQVFALKEAQMQAVKIQRLRMRWWEAFRARDIWV